MPEATVSRDDWIDGCYDYNPHLGRDECCCELGELSQQSCRNDLIVAIFALYPNVNDMFGNLSDATATLNRALNDVEEAAEVFIELANLAIAEASQ